ncbi:hypothetical protein EJ05DRAFT_522138 [Pseudovirgaria hyperparasitica]|uniref:Uncharacterized protein n=1 Tax=Pseudovirgaria hyperparasitica TaxID=470096 RepID=A0A6A6WGE3_9PEZI|nr:uncharacterized protein EJ05DRAFT_522138 [Pseudovirgaria hyperparasitica]KAF2761878.1 hypothetical protein EJ05DRAFT_522138 [Pseudovirgaria hyperparasitica]
MNSPYSPGPPPPHIFTPPHQSGPHPTAWPSQFRNQHHGPPMNHPLYPGPIPQPDNPQPSPSPEPKPTKTHQPSQADVKASFARLAECIPEAALTSSERALFFANIRLAFPAHTHALEIVSATSTRTVGRDELYHSRCRYLALVSFDHNNDGDSGNDGEEMQILAESGRAVLRYQDEEEEVEEVEVVGGGGGGMSLMKGLFRGLCAAVEEVVEGKLDGVRRRDGEREKEKEREREKMREREGKGARKGERKVAFDRRG